MATTAGFCLLGLLLTLTIHNSLWLGPLIVHVAGPGNSGLIRRIDPTCRLRGWHYLAAEVDRIRAEFDEPVLAASWWIYPGEIGFYCQGHPQVYSIGLALGDRHSQYDVWHPNPIDEPDLFAGTFVVVGATRQQLLRAFDRVEETHWVIYSEHGLEIARWPVTIGHGFLGFPAADTDKAF
jgi:hypothetical protein